MGDERRGSIEAKTEGTSDEGIGKGAGVSDGVFDDVGGIGENGGGAEARGTWDLRGIHAVFGFEPDAVFIDEGDEGDGGFEEVGGQGADAVEGAIRGSVEDIEAAERGESGDFVIVGRSSGR